ncbi:MAG: ABC transporter ATP-binding protein [Saccharothrix sp.]|nr:ABC transporter ATP-binding protein [Saccharothrix sp.]
MTGPLLRVDDLVVRFRAGRGRWVRAVDGVSLTLAAGECLAIVGASGSGKSAAARSLVGLAGPDAVVTSARMVCAGRELGGLREAQWRAVRGREIALVPQDALTALDPLRRVVDEVAEPLLAHRLADRADARGRVPGLLADVGLPDPEGFLRRLPHTLSGGQHQRVLIASAVAAGPKVIIADEPTTALDPGVQAQVLDLLAARKAAGAAVLLISHDLGVVARLADRVAVMSGGRIVEEADTARVLTRPAHPATRAMLDDGPAAPRDPVRPGRPVLELRDVAKSYPGGGREAVSGVSFGVGRGETVGLVGESGSGKTTTARLALCLLRPDAGEVLLDGVRWSHLPERARRARRGEVGLVHQSPLAAFDPRWTVRRVLAEPLRTVGVTGRGAAADLLDQVGLPESLMGRRPHELSGGERQRVAIARALATNPRVLVCDEPVSALDAAVRGRVLELLADLQRRRGLGLLLISHDLRVVRRMSDRVVVMRAGRVVEHGDTREVFDRPTTQHTRALLAAMPDLNP